jgi:hypothetical protein
MTPGGKDTLTSNHVASLQATLKQIKDSITSAKADKTDEGKELLTEAGDIERRVTNLKAKVAKAPLTDKDYLGTKDAIVAFQKKVKQELAALAAKPTVVYKFLGADVADEAAMIAKIKSKLPPDGHGNIKQAWNDVILGRGKSSGGLGCLHASAGVAEKKKGGCTLFFKRSGNIVEVVGVGQHEGSSSYHVYAGLGKEGKTVAL